jgi:hypothetical protein
LLLEVPGIELGQQSRPDIINIPGIPEDTLLKRMCAGKGLDRAEAAKISGSLSRYQEELAAAGWNIPQQYGAVLARVVSEWQIWALERFVPGMTGAEIFRHESNNSMKRHALGQVLGTMASYTVANAPECTLFGRQLTPLPHGVDLKPANIVLDERGKIWMVDTFAPKTIGPEGDFELYSSKLEALPSDASRTVCGTRQGALLRFLRKTQELWLASGSSCTDEFMDDVDYALALTPLPPIETDVILSEMNMGYPWLDRIYADDSLQALKE